MSNRFLLAIILLAVVVRFWGIDWGLPDKRHIGYSFHPDEAFHLEWALGLYDGSPIARAFLYGGTFHQTILKFSELMGAKLPGDIPLRNILLVARLFSLFAGVVTVILVFYIGKRLYGDLIGLLAALFLAVLPAHVYSSQQAKPDVIMAMFSTASVLSSLKRRQTGHLVWSLLSGLMVGMAMGTKISAIAFIFVPIAACIGRHTPLKDTLKETAIIFMAFSTGYLMVSPHILLYPEVFYSGLKIQYYYQSDPSDEFMDPAWLRYVITILPYGLGIPLLLASVSGIAMTLMKKEQYSILLLLALIPYYALLSWGSWVTFRYTTPLLPVLSVFAARAFWGLMGECKPLYRAVLYSLLALTVSFTLFSTLSFGMFLSAKDTRIAASEWIENNIKPGSTIGLVMSYKGDEFFNPPINRWDYRVWDQILRESYNIQPFLSYPFDYIIINEAQYMEYMRLGEGDHNDIRVRFFDHVMKGGKYRLIKEFKKRPGMCGLNLIERYPPSDELIYPSPMIRVYQRIG